jgi:hypothetical protein
VNDDVAAAQVVITSACPDFTADGTGSLTVQVVDDAQAPQAEVAVTGFGEPQGSFRGTTDVEGYVREPWLWPGFYRLEARASDGRVIDATVLVDPRSKTQHIIRLPRAP